MNHGQMKNENSIKSDFYDRFVATQNGLQQYHTNTSRRRHHYEADCSSLGNPFIRDFSVLLSSKAWRRMNDKNQVASMPPTPHIRNRATHVCEVIAEAARLADHLGLNVHLATAIAAGHDIGHAPFGHQGEHYLIECLNAPFSHEKMGVIIAQHLERRGKGLNLTHATLDGMYRHSGNNTSQSMTPEAWIVRYADKIAYLFADYNDLIRLRWPCSPELVVIMEWFGKNQRERTLRANLGLYEESVQLGKVSFEISDEAKRFARMRKLMYEEYVRVVEQNVERILDPIYDFLERSRLIPPWLGIALLTDKEVCNLVAKPHMLNSREIMETGLGEIIENTDREVLFNINATELDLDW